MLAGSPCWLVDPCTASSALASWTTRRSDIFWHAWLRTLHL